MYSSSLESLWSPAAYARTASAISTGHARDANQKVEAAAGSRHRPKLSELQVVTNIDIQIIDQTDRLPHLVVLAHIRNDFSRHSWIAGLELRTKEILCIPPRSDITSDHFAL